MSSSRFVLCAAALLAASTDAHAQTWRVNERPMRGAWLRPIEPIASLDNVLQSMANSGLTDLYLETFYWGVTSGAPGVFNARFGYDYLAQAIAKAARYGIRTHAWCESGYWQFGGTGGYNFTNNPEWRVISRATGATGGDQSGQVFANLAHPGVQAKMRAYFAELAAYPGIWGVQTDYHRYPLDDNTGDNFTAPWSYDTWTRSAVQAALGFDPQTQADTPGDGNRWTQFLTWRRNGISQAANQMHLGINSTNPEVTFSAAIFATAMSSSSQVAKCQDWPTWAANGYVDWLVPMAYGSTTGAIQNDLNITLASRAGRRVVAGLAIIAGTRPNITDQLNAIRGVGVEDFILFEATILQEAAKQTETRNWVTGVSKKAQADFNDDLRVDGADWTLFKNVYSGTPVSAAGRNARYNFNGDGVVDAADEARFKTEFLRDHFGDDGNLSDADRAYFLASFGATGAPGRKHLHDLNADGVVNQLDLGVLNEIAPPPPCAPDFNGDGFLDFFDYDEFVVAYEAGNPAADFNGDGFLDFFDFDEFVASYEAGC
jgi:uncharacterized lipoprotein YddW (UPF0748 family)